MKKNIFALFVSVLLGALLFSTASAQSEGFTVSLSRDFGYGGGNNIQGTFSIKASGPAALAAVDFMVDGVVVSTDTEAPFRYQFSTDAYPPGIHTLTAVGRMPDGTTLTGREFVVTFLTSEEAGQATMDLIIPLLAVVGGITVLGVALPLLFSRGKKFTPGQYGLAGGAVCTRCALPFSRSVLAPNMVFGKLERCPHCGKWAIVRAASPTELLAAEARLTSEGTATPAKAETDEEKLRRLADESRYSDS